MGTALRVAEGDSQGMAKLRVVSDEEPTLEVRKAEEELKNQYCEGVGECPERVEVLRGIKGR